MAEERGDVLARLLGALQKQNPGSRILILDLPSDTVLRAVSCKPSEHEPAPTVALTITVESLDFVALQEIAKRLTVTAAASEAAKAARKQDKAGG